MRKLCVIIAIGICMGGGFEAQASLAAHSGRILNVSNVAHCLAQKMDRPDFDRMNERYRFGAFDLILPYLALYSGMRISRVEAARALQEEAHLRWTTRWNRAEEKLAQALLAQASQTLSISLPDAWEMTQESCGRDNPFCSALLLHNVLRTLGRHTTACEVRASDGSCAINHNPRWFQDNELFWTAMAPVIGAALHPLSHHQLTGSYGDWYHFFGIITYATRAAALGDDITDLLMILDINHYGNPIFTGGSDIQDEEGALRDQDTVYVAKRLFRQTPRSLNVDCSDQRVYLQGE